MPRRSESERFQEWSERVSLCDRMLKSRYDTWRKYFDHYRQEIPESDKPDGQVLWINYMFQLARTVLPGLYFQNPDILAEPRGMTPLPYATAAEMILNHTIEEIDFERECRSVILDAMVCGIGVMKYGYLRGLDPEGTLEDQLASVMGQSLFDPDLWLEEEKETPYYSDYRIQEHLPFAFRVSPRMFLMDPLAGNRFERARWVAHVILRPEEEVRKDPSYARSLAAGVEGTVGFRDAFPVYAARVADGTVVSANEDLHSSSFGSLVKLYEIWDRETDQLLVIDEGNVLTGESPKFLREDANPYKIQGFPFEILVFNEDPEEIYGVSDASVWYNPTIALNMLNSAQYSHILRTSARKVLVEQGSLASDEDEAMLESATDMGIVHTNGPPDGAAYPLPDAPIPPDSYALRGVIEGELTRLSGSTEQRRSGGTPKGVTATEASIVESVARVRESDDVQLVAAFVLRGVRKIWSMIQQYGTADDFASVVGIEAMPALAQVFQPDFLKRTKVKIALRIGSMAYVSREIRTKQFLDWVNIFGSKLDALGQPIIDLYEAARYAATLLNVANVERFLRPQMPAGPPAQPGMGAPGMQDLRLRGGGPNMGDQLSAVQNAGTRRGPKGPNPRNEFPVEGA